MLAETKRNKDTTNQQEYRIKAEPNIHNEFFEQLFYARLKLKSFAAVL